MEGPRPSLPALRLLVSPVQLLSAAAWQTVQQKAVADYGMLEEFVSMVTDMVPELLTTCQRTRLIQGLKARKTLDETPGTLMWRLLSRLEKYLLPRQTFQQVGSVLGSVSSVLHDCLESVSQCQDFRAVLQNHTGTGQLDQLDGSSSVSGSSRPCGEAAEADTQQSQTTLDYDPSGTGAFEEKPQTHGTRSLKPCHVQLEKLHLRPSVRLRSARQNRGPRMKEILPHQEAGLPDEAPSLRKAAAKKAKQTPPQEESEDETSGSFSKEDSWYMAPISDCSEGSSWSSYSDEDSRYRTPSPSPSLADAWSIYSSDASSASSFSSSSSLSSCSNEDPPFAPSRGSATDVRGSTPKTPRPVYCFICKADTHTSLSTHMKTHFPTGNYACPSCDRRFKLLLYLKKHMQRTCYEYGKQQVDPEKLDNVENLHKCDKCHAAFRYKISLDRHKPSHDELYCGVCRKVLPDKEALARHKVSHTAFQCILCEQSFSLFMPLLRHCENIHHMRKPFQCSRCPKTLSRLRFLIQHEWTHTGHLPFRCAQCGCRFKFDADLMFHERVHTKQKPHLCAQCGKPFSKNSNLLRHLKLIHSDPRRERSLSGPERGKGTPPERGRGRGGLRRKKHFHQLCPQCGKMISRTSIDRHKLIHTGEKPFRCTVAECESFFRSATEVKRHVLVRHSDHRPFKCSECGKGFVKKSFLATHAQVHSGKKPFVCHICAKGFPRIYNLMRHKRLVHTVAQH